MVLEGLLNPKNAENYPLVMFGIGLLYTSLAILISMWVFYSQASLVMVFLTVLAATPLIYATIKMEEEKDLTDLEERELLRQHGRAVFFFMALFTGAMVAFSLFYVFLPADTANHLFSSQIGTIQKINGNVTADVVVALSIFMDILLNNMKVLAFCLFFSFIYGIGAVFILIWNASVIGAAIGNFIRGNLSSVAQYAGFSAAALYLKIFSLGFFRYAIHGIPEILAYFVAGLAGGIISFAAINHEFGSKNFIRILTDTSDLLIIAISLVLIGALLEVFVTPVLF